MRWLTLAGGAALLAGCVSPPPYPAYPPQGYLPPPYVAQPPVAVPQAGPVPLYPAPAPRREAMPAPEISVDPLPDPELVPEPEAPTASIPEPATPAPEPAPPPPAQAGPGADALQGFRPMRGQTRPGI